MLQFFVFYYEIITQKLPYSILHMLHSLNHLAKSHYHLLDCYMKLNIEFLIFENFIIFI